MSNLRKRIMTSDEGEKNYSGQYFTIVSLADNNRIEWHGNSTNMSTHKSIKVSTDGGSTWSVKRDESNNPSSGALLATLNEGEKLMIKYHDSATYGTSSGSYNFFKSTQDFEVEGNIMSLTTNGDFENADTVGQYAFYRLFYYCTTLKSAENLIMPATTLGKGCYSCMFLWCTGMVEGPKVLPATTLDVLCYLSMFSGCTSLISTPDMYPTTLANYCCEAMFNDCTSLINVMPILPATTLYSSCYNKMFERCINMTSSPILPATKLQDYCYLMIFNGCTKLNKITCLATSNLSAYHCKYQWTDGVSSVGTFIKSPNVTANLLGSGVNGIPSGWNVLDYAE